MENTFVGKISNVPQITYGYPVLDAGKRLTAVVFAAFRLAGYEGFIKKANLPQDSAVAIFDHQGLRLYRYPENDAAPLGRVRVVGFPQTNGLDEGTCERETDDGIDRIVAFKQLRLTESSSPYLLIMAGVPKDKILRKANSTMAWELLILGLAAAIAVSLAWFLGNLAFTKPINRLVSAAQRFGCGELNARTGLPHTHDELGELAQSLDSMAELLEQRNLESKKAKEELISALRKNDLILNAAGEGIVGLDGKGTGTFVNPAAREMLGYEEEELIGGDLHLMIHHSFPDGTHYPVAECPMWQSLRNGTSCHVRNEVLWKKDGTSFPAAYASAPIVEDGQVIGAVVSFRDISVRRRAEQALVESEEQFRATFELAAVGVANLALDGRWLRVNTKLCEILGYSHEEMMQRRFQDVTHPDDLKSTMELGKQLVPGKVGSYSVEKRYVRKDGGIVWCNLAVALARDDEGRPKFFIAVIEDITESKRAQVAVRESEEHYRFLFDNMLNGCAHCRMLFEQDRPKDFIYLSVNDAFKNLTGLENVVGKKVSEVIPGIRESNPELLEVYGRVSLSGIPERLEIYVKSLEMWFSISVYSPRKEHFVAIFDVITERKRAEELLKESKQQLENIINFLPDATFVINNEGEVIAWNEAIEEMTGVNASDMLGKGNYEYALPFYGERRPILIDLVLGPHEEILSKYTSIARRDTKIVGEAGIPALGTGNRYLYATASVLRDSTGNIVGAVESIRDITERKQAEQKTAQLAAIVEYSNDAIIGKNLDGSITSWNRGAENIYGYAASEVTGKQISMLFSPGFEDEAPHLIERIKSGEYIERYETVRRRKDGRDINMSLTISPVRDPEGRIVAASTIGRDITERKRAEEERGKLETQLRQSQKLEAIGTLAGGIAHDFNNILQPMMGYTEMALSKLSASSPMRDGLEQVLSASLRAKELIRQILTISRSAQEQQRIPTDISSIIKEALKLLRSSLPTSVEIRQNIERGVALGACRDNGF